DLAGGQCGSGHGKVVTKGACLGNLARSGRPVPTGAVAPPCGERAGAADGPHAVGFHAGQDAAGQRLDPTANLLELVEQLDSRLAGQLVRVRAGHRLQRVERPRDLGPHLLRAGLRIPRRNWSVSHFSTHPGVGGITAAVIPGALSLGSATDTGREWLSTLWISCPESSLVE